MSSVNHLYKGIATRLPVQDLHRARLWYSEKLGLDPVEERPNGLRYRIGDGEFSLFVSSGSSHGAFTQIGITVDDIIAVMGELRARGVVFLEYHTSKLRTVNGVARVEGNYPSKGSAELGCWFLDSEGNLIGLGQSVG